MKSKIIYLVLLCCIGCSSASHKKEAIDLNNKATKLFISNPDSALILFDKAIALDSSYHLAIQNKANLLIHQLKYAEALSAVQQLLAQKEYPEAWQMKGMLLTKLGKTPEDAEAAYKKALAIQQKRLDTSSTNKKAMENMSIALTYFLLGDTSKAKTLIVENKGGARDQGLGDSILHNLANKQKIIDFILK